MGSPATLLRKLLFEIAKFVFDNANKFLLNVLDLLVMWGIFDAIKMSFLRIFHIHTYMYQMFSATAKELRRFDAPTVDDMKRVLSTCYNISITISVLIL